MNQVAPARPSLSAVDLKASHLGLLHTSVTVPQYDRTQIGIGIAHISLGAFHRSHQAVYTDDVLAVQAGNWGILAIGAMPSDDKLCQTMQAQDCLYSVVSRDGCCAVARTAASTDCASGGCCD
jgi:mannitol-1-phosphate/altronate dehydrogenase